MKNVEYILPYVMIRMLIVFFSLQDLDRELEEICDKRRRLDDDNEARKKEIENLSVTFVKARAKNDRLKAEHNAVLANQIFLTARSDQIYAISFFYPAKLHFS